MRGKQIDLPWVAHLDTDGEWWGLTDSSPNRAEDVASIIEFGPRVPTPEELAEPRTEADERAAFDDWHQRLYGWKWDNMETPNGEDARARARWMGWRARAGLKGGAS